MSKHFNLGAWPVFHPSHQKPDKWQALKVLEESAEVVEAAKQAIDSATLLTGAVTAGRESMIGEIADLLQTTVNLCDAFGITESELEQARIACTLKNRQRGMFDDTGRTHMYRESNRET